MKTLISALIILIGNIIFAQQLPVLSTTSLDNAEDKFNHAKNGNYAMDTANERDLAWSALGNTPVYNSNVLTEDDRERIQKRFAAELYNTPYGTETPIGAACN